MVNSADLDQLERHVYVSGKAPRLTAALGELVDTKHELEHFKAEIAELFGSITLDEGDTVSAADVDTIRQIEQLLEED